MRLGLYVDLRNRPDSGRSWYGHYRRWLHRIEMADRLGCPTVWLSEHHFFDDGYLPQCWAMAGAIAARTSRIRIGTAVALLPLHTTIETAEQVALVDAISGGRVEPGFGVGYRRPEYEAFGGDYKGRYRVFRERIGALRVHWGEVPGELRLVMPPPCQHPVPMWGGFGGPQGARLAGELGLGLQSLRPDLLEPYLGGLADGGHDAATARMAGSVEVYLTDDPDRTWAEIEPFVTYRWASYNRYMFEGTRLEAAAPQYFDPATVRKNILLGTADEIAASLRDRFAGLPVTDVLCWADYPGLSDEKVDAHVEGLVVDLAPRLAATGPARHTSSIT